MCTLTPVLNDCFISYASTDLRFAEELYRRLMEAGFSVWFDKKRLKPGYDWHKEIEQGCESSRVLLPILTPRWKLSEWTRFRYSMAKDESRAKACFRGPMSPAMTAEVQQGPRKHGTRRANASSPATSGASPGCCRQSCRVSAGVLGA